MEKRERGSIPIYKILRGVLWSLVVTGLSLLVIAVIYLWGNFSENILRGFVTACALLSVFISSLAEGKSLKSKGLLMGGLIGILYSLCLYITGFLSFGFPGFPKGLLGTCALLVLSGIIGGVLGVNIRGKKS